MKTLRRGTTNEQYTVGRLVVAKSRDQETIEAIRRANEDRLDAEAETEALAMRRHRQVRPSVQKIGWKG